MRKNQPAIDTEALPWERITDLLQRKVLNGEPDKGPHTMLLRSAPREPDGNFAQYHPIDEEFFCLDGDFTFDGSTWFRSGSYAFYPAYFVHGTKVHVRGGYLVYLRLSGPSELLKVNEPLGDVPYYVGEGEPAARALQLVDAAVPDPGENLRQDSDSPLRATALHRDASSGQGSTLLSLGPDFIGTSIELESTDLLELFAVSGGYALDGGEPLRAGSYQCEVGERPTLAIKCTKPGSLMISHDGELLIRAGGSRLEIRGRKP